LKLALFAEVTCRNASINYFLFSVAGQMRTTDRRYVSIYSPRACAFCTGSNVGKKCRRNWAQFFCVIAEISIFIHDSLILLTQVDLRLFKLKVMLFDVSI